MYSNVLENGKVCFGLSFLPRSVCLSISSNIPIDSPSWYLLFIRHTTCSKGSFNNYVHWIFHFLTPTPHPRPCVDRFYTLSVDKNRQISDPLPPHLVHVVIEWPPMFLLQLDALFYEKLRDQNAANSPNFSLVSNNSISFECFY